MVFAVIKSSCGRWRDVIGVVRKSQRRKAKATLNDVTIVAVTEDAIHNTIGRPRHRYMRLRRMIQGRADRNQCCDYALMPHVPRKHAKAAPRPDKLCRCFSMSEVDAELDVRLSIGSCDLSVDKSILYI